ncbi:MAG: 3-phosphoshikimate 1-carboxyvinyltransferase, partial [Chloroflexi bacterium]|nr:3-phosphoshikimate 1-carboxyvinyltransferase [Chloroflexota bacterium]
MNLRVRSASRLEGEISLPGDKSITHRALMLGALGAGPSRIQGYLDGEDCRATMGCLHALGVNVEQHGPGRLTVQGVGLRGWSEPADVLDCVRSGTTMRLLAGLLVGQSFYSVLSGDAQLRRRPMGRVIAPLRQMGAQIWARDGHRLPPLSISGTTLCGIEYALPVASAQVKSCLLLAGLYAEGRTTVAEPGPSRDHTERMLRARGVHVVTDGLTHRLDGPVSELQALDTIVPGDLSSGAYFLVGALLAPRSRVLLRNVGANPTRTGLLDVLRQMGAHLPLHDERDEGGEPVADLWVEPQALCGAEVGGDLVPRMIDEFPILALAATQAQGVTRVRDAAELRVKETDRIATTVEALRTLGARIEATPDGFVVEGPTPLQGAVVDSHGDHRLAMTLA